MLVRILWNRCIKKRVPADLTCRDSGVHLLCLLPTVFHNRSNVSGCNYYYRFSISASHRLCKSVLKLFLLINDAGRWFSSICMHLGIPASWMLPCRAVSPFSARWSLLLGWYLSNNPILSMMHLLFQCQGAFYGSFALKSAFLPTSLVAIAANTFYSCSQLTIIIIQT
jgi:hypothetical protein